MLHVHTRTLQRVLAVEDTSMSVSREAQRHIFAPLITTEDRHSTGVGLAMSEASVKRQGNRPLCDACRVRARW